MEDRKLTNLIIKDNGDWECEHCGAIKSFELPFEVKKCFNCGAIIIGYDLG